MILAVLSIPAVLIGAAVVFGLALWFGQVLDRAASAAAGFATTHETPYAPWLDQDGDT